MKIFLSANSGQIVKIVSESKIKIPYYLYSFYYHKDENMEMALKFTKKEMLIDSGAHTFQTGVKVDYDEFTKKYIEFIKKYDCEKIVGYFEMDIDHDVGYEKVKQLRNKLEKVTDKIIPVWHKNRGIEEYVQMCKDYKGKMIALAGFRNQDIKDEQFKLFNNVAKKYNCKLHVLGLTRDKIMKENDFYSVDSSSWTMSLRFGNFSKFQNDRMVASKKRIARGETKEQKKENNANSLIYSLQEWLKYVEYAERYL